MVVVGIMVVVGMRNNPQSNGERFVLEHIVCCARAPTAAMSEDSSSSVI